MFAALAELSVFWRLAMITGFVGALTTFSTCSAEVFSQPQTGAYGWSFAAIAVYVIGWLAMTGLGMATFAVWREVAGGGR